MFRSRVLALVLGVSVAVSVLVPAGASAEAPPKQEKPKEREIVDRTERTRTFRNPDGSFTTESHVGKINYKDVDGTWKAIDAKLRTKDGRFENGAGPLRVGFASKASKADVVDVRGNGWSVGFGLEGAADSKAKADDYKITYPEVFPGIDLSYQMTSDGFKEFVVLKERAAAVSTFRFPLGLRNVDARALEDGSIGFVDAAGTEVAHVPPGLAFDSSGDRSKGDEPARSPVAYRLTGPADARVLEVEVDGGWLNDPARVYPVRVDPAFNAGRDTAGGDAFGRSDQPNTNFNNAGQTDDGHAYKNKIGYNGPEFVSAARFDLGPAMNKTIIAGTWNGYIYNANPLHQIIMWRSVSNWDENTMTFNNRPGHDGNNKSLNWAGNNAWMSHDVTDWVRNWTTPGGWANQGVVYDMGGQSGYYELASDEMGCCGLDSFINVNWQEKPPTVFGASDSPDPVNPGGTVTFTVDWSDPFDQARAVVCRTNFAANGDCASVGDRWGRSGLSSSGPSSTSYTTTNAERGISHTYYAFACDSSGACSSSIQGSFFVNNPTPSITSASDSPDPVVAGGQVNFDVGWSDPNETFTRTVVCKTNSTVNGGCTSGNTWTIGNETGSSPARATYTTTESDVGTRTYFAFACDRNSCSSSIQGSFTVNAPNVPPAIGTVSDTPDPVAVGASHTFSVGWTDTGDSVKAVVCKTNAVNSGTCPGGAWAIGSFGTTSPATVSRTAAQADVGVNSYWAFACDDEGSCSGSRSGAFTVSNNTPTLTSASDSPDPQNVGGTVTFSVGWTDPGDTVKAVICKSNAVSAGACSGGTWVSGSLGSATPATAAYTATQADVGTRTYYAFACDSLNVCSASSSGTFTVNNVAPTIGAVSDSPDPQNVGGTVTFSVGWTDPSDTARAVICKTNAVSAGTCTGGAWAVGTLGSATPATAAYTAAQADVGTKTYFAFACDSTGACSSSVTGTFTIVNVTPTLTSATDSPDPAAAGATVDFTVGWTDPGDTVKAVICKSNAVSAGSCPGGSWAIGSLASGGSSVASYTTAQANVGVNTYYAFACDSANACSSSTTSTFTVTNAVPGIVSASDSPDPVTVGNAVTFSVGWNDGGGDSNRAVVCKTNAVSAGSCPGGSWAIGSLGSTSPSTASYTTAQADLGTKTYYAFACDAANSCSSSLSGTFTVVNRVPVIGTVSDSPDPAEAGSSVTFSVGWTDPGDTVKAVVCRTNAVSSGSCSGGMWATGALSSTSPSTATLSTTQANVGTHSYFAFACDSQNSCSASVSGTFTVVNRTPTLTSASDSPDPVAVGSPVTFSASWSDPTDTVRALVCKTNAVSGGSCTGGAWAVGALTATSPATTTYTPVQADIGTRTYYVFVCDSLNACSSSLSGTFTVQNGPPTINAVTDSPDPVTPGEQVSFEVEWTDPGDSARAVICKTNAVSAGACTGGAWASGALSASSPSTAAYTTTEADIGTRTYYAFACDSANACSSGMSGTFTVEPFVEPVPPAGAARSDTTGLEDFYPYQPFDLGSGTAFVNTATRNLTAQYNDLAVPGQGLNLGLTRTYNANRAGVDGPIGSGWSLAVTDAPSSGLGRGPGVLATENQFAFDDADGTRHNFVKSGGAWRSPTGVNLVASNDTDAQGAWWAVTRPDGVRYEFRHVGLAPHLTRISDRTGNTLTFAYVAGRIATVTDSTGRTITFTWTNGYITRARYQAGASTYDVDYAVNAGSKTLTSVIEASGTSSSRTTSFGYTGTTPVLSSATDAKGASTAFAFTAGALTTLTDRATRVWTLTVGAACLADTPAGLTATCVVDPETKRETWLTSSNNLVERRDRGDRDEANNARTNRRSYVWVDNRLLRAVDEAGNLREFEWNNIGLLTATRLSGGLEAPLATRLVYVRPTPEVGDLTDVVAGADSNEERRWHFEYDTEGKGLLTSSSDPLGNATTYEYYAVRGLPKRVTDANSHSTTFGNTGLADGGYDVSGQPRRVADPIGAVTQLTYDFMGRLTQRIDRTGKSWTRLWDLRGNLTSETDPLNHTTLHCFDANDNELLTVRPKAPSPSCALDGTDGYSTKNTYDQRDLLASVLTASDGQRRKSTYTYDDDGELREIKEPRSFDAATGNPSGTVQKVVYERYDNNRVSAFVDEEGNRTDVVYTPDGLPRRVTDPPSNQGRHLVVYDYNKLRLVRSELESGHGAPTTYQYNLHGEQVAQSTPLGSTTISQYDNAGRLTATINAHGRSSTRTYDPVGNLLSVSQPAGILASLITSYTYTARDEIASETDPADPQHVIEYTYDGEGRQRFRHDHYGLQVPGGPVEGSIERTTEQRYWDDGKLSERISTYAGTTSGTHRAVFDYDANGNTKSIDTYADSSSNVSQITATHTTADELKTWTETIYPPSGAGVTKASAYGYERDGLLVSRTVDGQTTLYEHTLNGHEKKTTPSDSGLGVFNTTYFGSGLPSRTTMPNGTAVDYGYDLADRMQSKVVRHPTGAVFSAWEHMTYDDNDNRLSEVVTQRDTFGATRIGTAHNIYDKLDRLIASKHPLEVSLVPYVLDDAGNVLTETSWVYAYVANRLTSRSPFPGIGGITVYGYDHFGNRTTETQGGNVATTIYDAASHTTTINDFGGFSIGYRYDGLDRQIRRFDSSNEVRLYFHDGATDQVALETDGTGAVKMRYVLDSTGEPLANEEGGMSTMTGRGYYVTDPRGNLSQLLDHNAVGTGPDVVATFGYDPFGSTKSGLTAAKTKSGGSGTWDSRLRFQLSPRDKRNGQYAIGPRMYDPATYRFVGADWVAGSAAGMELQLDPLTGNRYLYAGCNPVNLIDDGHKPKKPKDYEACGKIRVLKGGALFEITEVARDVDEGWVEYHINFTALGRYERKSLWTTLHVQGKRVGWKKAAILQSVDSRVRDRTRADSKPYYAHTTQRVKIGTELTFSGQIDYREPWWGFDWSGVKLLGTCRA